MPDTPVVVHATRTAPQWAVQLVSDTLTDYHYWPTQMRLEWKNTRYIGSRAFAEDFMDSNEDYMPRINVSAGQSQLDQWLVVLHECTHLIIGTLYEHEERFYGYLLPLCMRAGIPMDYVVFREWKACWPEACRMGLGGFVTKAEAYWRAMSIVKGKSRWNRMIDPVVHEGILLP